MISENERVQQFDSVSEFSTSGERRGLSAIATVAKCSACGASARLDHMRPHPSAPVDQYVYVCPHCQAVTIVERPRVTPPEGVSQLPASEL